MLGILGCSFSSSVVFIKLITSVSSHPGFPLTFSFAVGVCPCLPALLYLNYCSLKSPFVLPGDFWEK